ncbi:MAG: dihydroneopterin aldolase [Nitrospirae bacterium]|nr:dihydroneopterin aldolase [Nitrospirota bacterium]
MDRIIITDIEFIGHCGITEEERHVGQRISADIQITLDLSKVAASDRLEDTVDYVSLCDKVVSIGRGESYHLLETLAERVAREILQSFKVSEVTVRLRKCPAPVEAIKGHFEVEITRKRQD